MLVAKFLFTRLNREGLSILSVMLDIRNNALVAYVFHRTVIMKLVRRKKLFSKLFLTLCYRSLASLEYIDKQHTADELKGPFKLCALF